VTVASAAVAATVVAATAVLAGCGGLPNPLPAGRHYKAPVTGASAAARARPVSPLTGLPAASASAARRPAIAVPLAGARLTGLAAADVVFEDVTTPQVRYLALYQSRPATSIGPVTSTRPEDNLATSVLHPLMAYAGGKTGFLAVLRHSAVTGLGYGRHHQLYHGPAGRRLTSTAALWRAHRAAAPTPLFVYQGSSNSPGGPGPAGAVRLSAVRVLVPHRPAQRWVYDPASRRWTQVSGGPRVSVANLVIQTVRYKTVYLDRRPGITARSARPVGGGRATILSGVPGGAPGGASGGASAASGNGGGQEVRVDWSKPNTTDITNYFSSRGVLAELTPGPTWVLFAPAGTRVVRSGGTAR
jgi:hypothetical protein